MPTNVPAAAVNAVAAAAPAVAAAPATIIGTTNPIAIVFFLAFVVVTLGITYWAAKRTRTTKDFYAAGRSITGFQNGLALAGDYMSAASFLGIAGLVSTKGYDGLIYSVGWLVGWPIIMFLISEPLRNLGKYTFSDVVAYRLRQRPIRAAAAAGSLATVLFYLIAQMVGAGTLIKLMFGLPFEVAIVVVGVLMISYVLFGGMLATTWVQIIKAGLLLGGATLLVALTLGKFHFSYGELFAQAEKMYSPKFLEPGGLVSDPLDAFSLGLALMFGTAGLPHILMRFYTVPNAREARKSVFYATGFIGYFYILTVTIGFGAAVLVGQKAILAIDKGGNMAAPMLAEALGGSVFLGFLAAVAFATILAVVAGLTLAGASALSHDLYVGVIRRGVADEKQEVRVAKFATVGLGIAAILLGILFKGQNVAFMVGLAFAIAASANFPALLLSITWKKFTTMGATLSIYTGMILAVLLITLSPTVWVDIIHLDEKKAVEAEVSKIDTAMKTTVAALDKSKTVVVAPTPEQIAEFNREIVATKTQADAAKKDAKKATKDKKALAKVTSDIDIQAKAKIADLDKRKTTPMPPSAVQIAAIDANISAEKKKAADMTIEAKKKMPKPIFPLKNPGIYSMGAAFLVAILVSLMTGEKEAEEKYEDERLRSYVGIGSE